MQALFSSFGMVAVAEIGDKTQLLSFLLAARFPGRQRAIVLGILVATLANHFGAAALGSWVAAHAGPGVMRWVLGLAFLGFAAWALVPDKLDDGEAAPRAAHGAFWSTLVAFFLAEMGDKTQFATIALGAQYPQLLWAVVLGTTAGMMAANVPAVMVGGRLAQKLPLSKVRFVAAALFALFGVAVLLDLGTGLQLGTR